MRLPWAEITLGLGLIAAAAALVLAWWMPALPHFQRRRTGSSPQRRSALVFAAFVGVTLGGLVTPELPVRGAWQCRFRDVTSRAGVGNPGGRGDAFLVPQRGTKDERLKQVVMRGGAAWLDYDGDGRLDLYVVNDGTSVLYHNQGDGTFSDAAHAGGVAETPGGMGVAAADYDNDGWTDLYVTRKYYPNQLFHNNGNGTFTDVARMLGVADQHYSTGAAWGDYDLDGRLDLYLTHYLNQANLLYHQNSDGTFTDVTWPAGVSYAAYGMQPLWIDYNQDLWPDLYIINDMGADALFRNQHDGTFRDVTLEANTEVLGGGMGGAVGDFMNTGRLGIFISQFDGNALLLDNGEGRFRDVAREAGVFNGLIGWGTFFFDCDNDGWLDLFVNNGFIMDASRPLREPNALYRNNADGTFTNIAPWLGIDDPSVGRGAVVGDYDGDGAEDIYLLNLDRPDVLLHNETNRHHWLSIKLVGTKSNRDGIGAKVQVVAGNQRQMHEIASGGSYLSSNSLDAHFGLGRHAGPVSITITWPSHTVQHLTGVPVDQRLIVEEPR